MRYPALVLLAGSLPPLIHRRTVISHTCKNCAACPTVTYVAGGVIDPSGIQLLVRFMAVTLPTFQARGLALVFGYLNG